MRRGKWRRIGGRVQLRPIDVPSNDGVRVFLLRAGARHAAAAAPSHRHRMDLRIPGRVRHQLGRYSVGDFDEADETVEHHPVVEDGAPCICVVALPGGIKLQSLIGRLVQPFIRL